MKSRTDNKREVVSALIRLSNNSQGKTADAAGLGRQSVSNWLTGRDNAMSQEKQLRLLETLGVRYGRLRSDIVHRWCIHNIADATVVLESLLSPEDCSETLIWRINNYNYPGSAILQIPNSSKSIWIVMYRPFMDKPPTAIDAAALHCGKEMEVKVNIDNLIWESWLPPAEMSPDKFGAQFLKLYDEFPYNLPPADYLNGMEEESSEEGDPDVIAHNLSPTVEETAAWIKLLIQAKLSGRNFTDIMEKTEQVLKSNIRLAHIHKKSGVS